MTSNDRLMSRRRFLELSGAAGGTAAFSTLTNLHGFAHASAASLQPGNDYKALVCVFQPGGNDSFNMLVPTDDESWERYASIRDNVALLRDGSAGPTRGPIHELNTLGGDGRTWGVHPAMGKVRDLFDSGALGFIANVGTLVEPITPSQYRNNQRRVPRALFSHNDQIAQWQSAVSERVSDQGWAGRIADVFAGIDDDRIATNISLGGTNVWQTGEATTNYSITSRGSIPLVGKGVPPLSGDVNARRYVGVGLDPRDPLALSGRSYGNLLQQAYLNEMTRSVQLDLEFSAGFNSIRLATQFPNTDLGQQLRAVARTIAVHAQFGLRRQVFYVNTGSWDHHQELLNSHAILLSDVSESLAAFWEALGEIGMRQDVVAFTMSDFGRTLRTNGRGTDHGWGGNHMVLGGPVLGQRIHGLYPTPADMSLGAGLDIGDNGRLLPTTALDMYAGELARWFGVSSTDLDYVLPNVREFFAPEDVDRPIGFLEGGNSVGIPRASVVTSCALEDGRFDIDLVNTAQAADFVVRVGPSIIRNLRLGPDEAERIIITGRYDRDWPITVDRNGVRILETSETVSCDPLGPAVVVEQSCAGENGRVDVFLSNSNDFAAEYEVRLGTLTPRTRLLRPRETTRISYTGRPDGPLPLEVSQDGDVIERQELLVQCDPVQDVEVALDQSCLSGRGRLDFRLFNDQAEVAVYDIRVGLLSPRIRVVPAGTGQQVTFTGRTNGSLRTVVLRNGLRVWDRTVTINC